MSAFSVNRVNTGARMRVLGVPVDVVTLADAVERVCRWAAPPKTEMVFVRDVASLMASVDAPTLMKLHEKAALVVPDGTPLVWYGKLRGYGQAIGRVTGADLVDAVCAASAGTGQKHYFYGGLPGVAETMAKNLQAKYPGLEVAGAFSPPMRHIGPEFKLDYAAAISEVDRIRSTEPHYIWVGLSSPKQEYWMSEAASLLSRGVLFGVGAAFDFHAGRITRAPRWMRNNGLEWLHRLLSEPRRLWYRYLVLAPRFAFSALAELLKSRRKQ
jgi:N-acetylglucosaminyldiphosphoundecaprenol N-acetyl-beta-D-mannosaminyltransferase